MGRRSNSNGLVKQVYEIGSLRIGKTDSGDVAIEETGDQVTVGMSFGQFEALCSLLPLLRPPRKRVKKADQPTLPGT